MLAELRSEPAHSKTPEEKREYEQRRVDWYNSSYGSLSGYDCPICRNKGNIAYLDEDGYRRVYRCDCMKIRANQERIQRSGLADAVTRYTFDSWQDCEPWQEQAKKIALEYAQNKQGWFIAFGSVGTGKSHICTAICNELMKDGMDVLYSLWRDVSTKAKAAVNNTDQYAEIVEPMKTIPVLYIDDFYKTGKGQEPTTADVNLAFEIINARYTNSSLLTIISTELTIAELMDIDEAVGSRIYEKCKGHGVSFVGHKNWRLQNN